MKEFDTLGELNVKRFMKRDIIDKENCLALIAQEEEKHNPMDLVRYYCQQARDYSAFYPESAQFMLGRAQLIYSHFEIKNLEAYKDIQRTKESLEKKPPQQPLEYEVEKCLDSYPPPKFPQKKPASGLGLSLSMILGISFGYLFSSQGYKVEGMIIGGAAGAVFHQTLDFIFGR